MIADAIWDGSDDLTSAVGFEKDGETTILFRKKLDASHFSDHEIVNDNMHVIWAIGQEPQNYFHSPKSVSKLSKFCFRSRVMAFFVFGLRSGLEKGPAAVSDFYRADEIKYHGKKNRGTLSLNFFDEVKQSIGANAGEKLDFCGGEWKYPRTCEGLVRAQRIKDFMISRE